MSGQDRQMSQLPPTSYNDTRVRLGTVLMVGIGLVRSAAYVLLAVRAALPGLFAGVRVALLGIAFVWVAHRRWVGAVGERGGGGLWMLLGSVLIIGSLWAAFMTSDALR